LPLGSITGMEIVGVLIEASPIRLPGLVQFLPSLFPSRKCATAKHQNNNEGHDDRGVLVIDWIDPAHGPEISAAVDARERKTACLAMPRGSKPSVTAPHVILRSFYLEPKGTTTAKFAAETGVSLAIVEGRSPFTQSAATKIAAALGTSPLFWLTLQKSATPRR